MAISDNIKKIRKLRKMTQQDLADKIGEKRSTYAEWENGIVPKGDILAKIASALGVSLSELISGNSDKSSEPNDKILAQVAMIAVLLDEISYLKAEMTGESAIVIKTRLQKSAEDVARLMSGNGS